MHKMQQIHSSIRSITASEPRVQLPVLSSWPKLRARHTSVLNFAQLELCTSAGKRQATAVQSLAVGTDVNLDHDQ